MKGHTLKWFQRDTNQRNDPKIIKLRMKFPKGEGYEVYDTAREMIAARIEGRRADCQLEEDELIISHVTHIPPDRVQVILLHCVDLGLLTFDPAAKRFCCPKLLYRLDDFTARSPYIRDLLNAWRRGGWGLEKSVQSNYGVASSTQKLNTDTQIEAFTAGAHAISDTEAQALNVQHAKGKHKSQFNEQCPACQFGKAATA